MTEPKFIVVDLFCGAGGTTTGFALTDGLAIVAACVNHDANAIESHWLNHPEVEHFEEDITKLYGFVNHGYLFATPQFVRLKRLIEIYTAFYPDAKIILWASLECTNFSKAKGGLPRDADSRTLADHLHFYIDWLNPDYIQIENVVEFMSWGPLDEKGKPISKKNGADFLRWRREICEHGYYDEWREMNSADYGAYTSRNRLFGIFTKPGLPIAWPDKTHYNPKKVKKSNKNQGDLFDFISTPAGLMMQKNWQYLQDVTKQLAPWNPVKEVLNFNDEGQSIFGRKKALSDKTLERIYAGLLKFVAKGDSYFISKYFSGRPAGKVNSVESPASTITTFGGQYLVQTKFIQHYYGNGFCTSVEQPLPTITTKERCALITPVNKGQNQSINEPAGTIMTTDKHRLVQAVPFIMPTAYNNQPTSIESPSPVITANRKHHYLVNPAWGGNPGSVDEPCCVIVARQDKAPLYFVQVEEGSVTAPVYDCDSEIMIKIKQFMVAYGLVDIKMRMLRIPELLKIQGFPEDYKLVGNESDKKKFIGNSVHPYVPQHWAPAIAQKLSETKLQAA